jgi:hypothetical protein
MNEEIIDGDAVKGYACTDMAPAVKHPLGTTPVSVTLQNYTYRRAIEAVESGKFFDLDVLMNIALVEFLWKV